MATECQQSEDVLLAWLHKNVCRNEDYYTFHSSKTVHDFVTSLKKLEFYHRQIATIPPEFKLFTSLSELNLSNNKLTSLPCEFGALTQLQQLYIPHNNFTSVPTVIGQLNSLKDLNLSDNDITSIPPWFGDSFPKLECLVARDCQLTHLPPELGKLSSLSTLVLCFNRLLSVPPEFAQLTSLGALSLSSNRLTSLPAEFEHFVSLKYLYLYLNDNHLTAMPIVSNTILMFGTNQNYIQGARNQKTHLTPSFVSPDSETKRDFTIHHGEREIAHVNSNIMRQRWPLFDLFASFAEDDKHLLDLADFELTPIASTILVTFMWGGDPINLEQIISADWHSLALAADRLHLPPEATVLVNLAHQRCAV